MTIHRRTVMGMTSAMLALRVFDARAQSWPSRPIRIIVSQAAGAAPDLLARQIAEQLTRSLGQTVIVDNKPGGANAIGAQAAARSPADGYTLFFATAAALVTNPLTFKKLPYDPDQDFVPVRLVGVNPFFVLVHPSVPAKTLPELVALDRQAPGTLTFSSDGQRGFAGMLGEWLNKTAGSHIRQVPYSNTMQSAQDAIGGVTQVTIQAIVVAAPFIKSGALRPIAISSSSRVAGYEDVPTVAETYPGFEINGWIAMVAPTGTPAAIVEKLSNEISTALKNEAVANRLKEFGFVSDLAGTPATLATFIAAEKTRWTKLTQSIGLEPE